MVKSGTASKLSLIASLPKTKRDKFLDSLSVEEQKLLAEEWAYTARPNQLAPPGNWTIWLMVAGRGFGKTRAGAEWLIDKARNGAKRLAIIARSAADYRDTAVCGASGIIACAGGSARFEPSKRRVIFDNGAQITCYSAEEPSALRGPTHEYGWLDEISSYKYPDAIDQFLLGLRHGDDPRCVMTTTPKPRRFLRRLMDDPRSVVTGGSTLENRANLPPQFIDFVYDKYAGSHYARQELEGKFTEALPGALFERQAIEGSRKDPPASLVSIVVAVDPAVTSKSTSDESGLIVAGSCAGGDYYILEDASFRGAPDAVMSRAVELYQYYKASAIIVEENQGGDTWRTLAEMADPSAVVQGVRASRGKFLRAEPVSARFQQGRVHIPKAQRFETLEDELCSFVIGSTEHDDRVDALVYAITYLDECRLPSFEFNADNHFTPEVSAIWG